jgi:hypothetical protein
MKRVKRFVGGSGIFIKLEGWQSLAAAPIPSEKVNALDLLAIKWLASQ